MCSHLSCKIRFEVPKRQRGREVRREREKRCFDCKVNFDYRSRQY